MRLRYAGYSDPSRIAFDHAALRHLSERDVAVLGPRATTQGKSWVPDGDRAWEVFPFVDGTHPSGGNEAQVAQIGEALARFHAAGENFSERYDKIGPRGETDPIELLDVAAAIDRDSPDCTRVLRRYREWTLRAAQCVSSKLYGSLPHTLVHGDIQPANIIMEDDRVAAFVDVDWCGWRPRVYDLAYAILFCCRTSDAPIDGGDIWSLTQPPSFDASCAQRFLETYRDHTVTPLNVEHIVLSFQIVLTWCHCRLAGALKVPPNRRREFLARGPETVTGLGGWMR